MGAHFSSQQLSGGAESGIPTVSYGYSSGNPVLFGADATYSYSGPSGGPYGPGLKGYITPYLVQPSAPTATCSPFSVQTSNQVLKCPVTGASLAAGLYTLSFSQYTTTSTVGTDSTTTYFKDPAPSNTLTDFYGGAFTFSVVKPTTTVASTLTTTVTSGVSEILATATHTVPQTVSTVTVYQTTVISTQTSLSTLSGASTVVTVTAACPPATLLKCNADNCLRALRGKSATASAFCSQYTKTLGMATPTYASQCSGLTSRVSSACSCYVTASPSPLHARGYVAPVYGHPDFTYDAVNTPATVTASLGAISTTTVGPIPSATS